MIRKEPYKTLLKRLQEQRQFIQILGGPRQVGKTTLIQQLIKELNNSLQARYVSADDATIQDHYWLNQQWEAARIAVQYNPTLDIILIVDEIQKIPDWSAEVKKLWDADTRNNINLKVVLLGSSPLLIQKGLTESLAGRFEVIPMTHWNYSEMQEAFGWDLETYIYFGGYPGAASLIEEEDRWQHYILDSLIETTVSRDILLLNRVDKPALLRCLFQLGCQYSGQILSFQKLLGQLQDAGNTTTLSHYLELLSGAGLLTGIPKYAGEVVRQRASSPKFNVLNMALKSAGQTHSFDEIKSDPEQWGHFVESAVGAHLLNSAMGHNIEISYWRENNKEIDFIIQRGEEIIALEVKSTRRKIVLPGIDSFMKKFKPSRVLQVGGGGISLEEFFKLSVLDFFK